MKATHNDAIDSIRLLSNAGHTAYLAGGCVRDLLLGREPNDFDVTTSATPEQVQSVFGHSLPVGASFGVIKVIYGENRELDVATFRKDGKYSDNRRPDEVTYTGSSVEDVQRRDFTINGMLMTSDGEVIDYVHGQDDLKAGVIRCIGDPLARFGEDALRMMRAVRFATRFRYAIEVNTYAAIQSLSDSIKNISRERVTDELTKTFACGRCDEAFWLLCKTGLWKDYFRTSPGDGDCFEAMFALAKVNPDEDFVLPLALILCDAYTGVAEATLEKLSLTVGQQRAYNSLIKRAKLMTDFLSKPVAEQREMMQWENKALVLRFLECNDRMSKYQWSLVDGQTVKTVFSRMKQIVKMGWPCPLVNGDDLIKMGFIPGKVYTDMLSKIRGEQLEGRLTEKSDVKSFILKEFPAAPRKLEDGSIVDGMTRRRVVSQCTKCKQAMSFTVEMNPKGKPIWPTAREEQNVTSVSGTWDTYVNCMNCQTRRKKTKFVEAVL